MTQRFGFGSTMGETGTSAKYGLSGKPEVSVRAAAQRPFRRRDKYWRSVNSHSLNSHPDTQTRRTQREGEQMSDIIERRSRLVTLAYRVLGTIDLPPIDAS